MAHIHTKPGEHDLTASAFIIDNSTTEPRVWLHLHKKLGKWMQFGGHVELNEDPWTAVCREIAEESGFEMSQLAILQPKQRPQQATDSLNAPQPAIINTHRIEGLDHYHIDLEFVFLTSTRPALNISEGESSDMRTFSIEEIRAFDETKMPQNAQNACEFILSSIFNEWQPVACSDFNR